MHEKKELTLTNDGHDVHDADGKTAAVLPIPDRHGTPRARETGTENAGRPRASPSYVLERVFQRWASRCSPGAAWLLLFRGCRRRDAEVSVGTVRCRVFRPCRTPQAPKNESSDH